MRVSSRFIMLSLAFAAAACSVTASPAQAAPVTSTHASVVEVRPADSAMFVVVGAPRAIAEFSAIRLCRAGSLSFVTASHPRAARSQLRDSSSRQRPSNSSDGPAAFLTMPMSLFGFAGMTALAKERDTRQRAGPRRNYGVAASTKVYLGSLVMLDGGLAKPGATATGQIAVGRACETVDNTAGADGALTIDVERGEFLFGNSASGDLIAVADIGADCYIVDDQTVAKTSGTGTRSKAGTIAGVDTTGVWVAIGVGGN